MLPPSHLRQGSLILSRHHFLPSSILRASTTPTLASTQPYRTLWGWRRSSNNNDWTSQLDPLYHRFCRIRTLKTRAKLLRKLQRRGKFDWDNSGSGVGDFFTPKQCVRWATRWDGGRSKHGWYLGDDGTIKKRRDGQDEGDGGMYELSQREKVWKEQMEVMRRRIESDPYEAIFGKRFEPFWSPLVPSWMREEMGLPVWGKGKEGPQEGGGAKLEKVEKVEKVAKMQESAKTTSSPPLPVKKVEPEKKMPSPAKVEPEVQKPAPYAYASSTSWNSWTNKTKRVEWDSVSGQTKKYEYDPISNRMVLVEAPQQKAIAETPKAAFPTTKAATDEASSQKKEEATSTPRITVAITNVDTVKAVDIPIKQSIDLRKSIPIPPPLSQPSHSIAIGFASAPTSVGLVKNASTAIMGEIKKSTAVVGEAVKRPSALAKIEKQIQLEAVEKPTQENPKEKDLETLTADDVRASMGGKNKPSTSSENTSSSSSSSVQTQVDALLSESCRTTVANDLLARSELESLYKKKEKLQNDERRLFHIERQKKELQKLDQRIREVTGRVERLGTPTEQPPPVRDEPKSAGVLQSSLERMQSKDLPKKTKVIEEEAQEDADDAAAHESTEPVESVGSAATGVPKDWAKQAELLQADRVRRLSARSAMGKALDESSTMAKPRQALTSKADAMSILFNDQASLINSPKAQPTAAEEEEASRKSHHAALRAADEARAAEEVARIQQEKKRVEREKKLEKANALLESEVAEQKSRMAAHENRYAHKIRALREELERGYRMSSVHSEKHLERIRFLEGELGRVVGASGGEGKGPEASATQTKEGLARRVEKWGQQASEPKAMQREMEKVEQKKRDKELVKEIREIYERRYGVIDTQHQQAQPTKEDIATAVKTPQVVEVESDVDLGEALAKYEDEKQQRYVYSKDDVEAQRMQTKEAQAKEREVNEGVRLVDDSMPKLIPTDLSTPKPPPAAAVEPNPTAEPAVQWAEPPLYKVLAYDSGNDFLSTATTTSNFTGVKEEPISIPEALSQLYAPARFVGSFAELQKEGFQVIFGTKEILVFRKVADAPVKVVAEPSLEDHGLVAGTGHPDHWAAWPMNTKSQGSEQRVQTEVNPVDGTSPSTAATAKTARGLNDGPSASNTEDVARKQYEDADFDIRHYPRVKREEYPVFTGTRRRWSGSRGSSATQEAFRKYRKKERKERRYRRRAVWRRAIGVGIGAAGVMYVVGAAAEKSRAGESKGEDWVRKAEEARRDWRREGW